MSTTTPPPPRRSSSRRRPPLQVVTNADETSDDINNNKHQNEKERAEEEEENEKLFLSLRQRALILLGLVLIVFFIVWQSKPFERVIAAILPQLNETQKPQTQPTTNATTPSTSSRPTTETSTFSFQQCRDNATECCNGLDNICDMRVNDVMFATLHNGMATKEDGSLLRPNHLFSLESAFKAGYRGLHLQVCNCNGVYQFCRDYCHLGARHPSQVFLNMDRFLRDHPNDVLLLMLQLNSNADQQVQLEDIYQVMKNSTTKLVNKLYVHHDDEEQWPTLRDMIRSNKRILLFHYDGPTCSRKSDCPAGMHYWHKYGLETKGVGMATLSDLAQPKKACFVYRGKEPDQINNKVNNDTHKFFAVHNFLENPDPEASQVANSHSFLSNQMEVCSERNGGLSINILSVDFWQEGDVVEYVQRQNRYRGELQGYIAV